MPPPPPLAFTRIESGGFHSCASDNQNRLWCWGKNDYGQLGVGATKTPYTKPQLITAQPATWQGFTLAEEDTFGQALTGGLWGWGANYAGELATNDTVPRALPTAIGTIVIWQQPSAGRFHVCALRQGALWCWGENNSGELGLGDSASDRFQPVQVGLWIDWIAIDAGGTHTCGIRSGGALYCWGSTEQGQVGIGISGPNKFQLLPAHVGTSAWNQASLGKLHTCGVQTNGSLWCWGHNFDGELGLGDVADRSTPQQVGTALDWVQVAPGWFFTCGIRKGGTLWCWGDNLYGQLGTTTTGTYQTSPLRVAPNIIWLQVSPGMEHCCGLGVVTGTTTSVVWCWGRNTHGQLGTGDTNSRPTPTRILP